MHKCIILVTNFQKSPFQKFSNFSNKFSKSFKFSEIANFQKMTKNRQALGTPLKSSI